MNIETVLVLGVMLLYCLGTAGIFSGVLAKRRSIQVAANWITLAGFALHTVYAPVVFFSHTFEELSAGYFLQLLAWCLIFIYLMAWRFLRLPFLSLTAAPLALLLFMLSLRETDLRSLLPDHLAGLFFGLHVGSLYISMGLLALAFGAGLLFIYMERQIKKKAPLTEFARDLSPLSAYDKVNQAAVMMGFPLYTLGILSGFLWTPIMLLNAKNPKLFLSMLIWFLYALLFYQRSALGYRGRKTAVTAIVIFIITVIGVGVDYTFSHHSIQFQP